MKNTTNQVKNAIAKGAPVYAYAVMTLSTGTVLTLTSQDDFCISGNSYTQSCNSGFPLGDAICKSITISIDNHSNKYSQYDFYKATILLYSEIDVKNDTERLLEGKFTVIDSITPGDVISITAYDDMYKADKKFSSNALYPTTCLNLLQEACTACNITLDSSYQHFRNYDYIIQKKPNPCTCRQIIGYIAQIACGNALISANGNLIIKSYADLNYTSINTINARNVNITVPDTISGGVFSYGELTDAIQSGALTNANYAILKDFSISPEISTDDITITGISIDYRHNNQDTSYQYGTADYSLKIENPLLETNSTTQIKSAIDDIGFILTGMTLRPFSGSFAPNPLIEFMDIVLIVDLDYNIYQSVAFSHTFNYLGNSELSNDIPSPEKNGAVYSYNASSLYEAARTVANDRSDWEAAINELNTELQGIGGLYETTQTQPDQSVVYYIHDKPNLNDSVLVIKINNSAIGISHNGVNGTYDTGISLVTGNAVVNQLDTIGLSADWVRTGTMEADRISGGSLSIGGLNNADGEILVYDDNANLIGSWGYSGLQSLEYAFESSSSGTFKLCSSNESHTSGDGLAIIEGTNQWFGVFGNTTTGVATDPKLVHGTGGWHFYANTTWHSSGINLNGNTLSNAVANDLDASGSFEILNNTTVDFYSSVNCHNYTHSNIKLSNLIEINGNSPITGSVNFIKDITTDSNGVVTSITTGTLTFEDGILVGW